MKQKLVALALHEKKCFIIGPKIFWGEVVSGVIGKCQCSVFLFKWTEIIVAVIEVYFIFHLVPYSLDTRMNLSIWQNTSRRINRPVLRGSIFMSH